jgi:hypothetical protein
VPFNKADFHRSYLADENYDSFISFLKEPMKVKKVDGSSTVFYSENLIKSV